MLSARDWSCDYGGSGSYKKCRDICQFQQHTKELLLWKEGSEDGGCSAENEKAQSRNNSLNRQGTHRQSLRGEGVSKKDPGKCQQMENLPRETWVGYYHVNKGVTEVLEKLA